MDIVGFIFIAWVILSLVEKRDLASAFPPGPCAHCDQCVYLRGEQWLHVNGEQYMPFPNLPAANGFPAVFHPASPRNLFGEAA